MATSGRPLDPLTRSQILRLLISGCSRRTIAKTCRVCKRTVDKLAREQNVALSLRERKRIGVGES